MKLDTLTQSKEENIYVYSKKPTESDAFLRREFRFNIQRVERLIPSSHKGTTIVMFSDFEIDDWLQELDIQKPNSVIVLLLGSETLNLSCLKKLKALSSVKVVFAQYFRSASLWNAARVSTFFVRDFPLALFDRLFFIALSRGFKRYIKSTYIRFFYKIRELPLGYTSKFEKDYIQVLQRHKMELGENHSLFVGSENRKIGKVRNRKLFFQGYKSGPVRKIVLEKLSDEPYSVIKINDSWGGIKLKNQLSYVQEMIQQSFTLNPPGHTSNETYRKTESLICGSFPIFTSASLQDWSSEPILDQLCGRKYRYSYRNLFKYLNTLNNDEVERIVDKAKEILQLDIKGTRTEIMQKLSY